jgi:acyl-CoA thioesterase
MPFNHHLGAHVTRLFNDGVAIECEFRPEMGNWHGTLHGGVIASLVDIAVGMSAIALSGGRRVSTVDMHVSYLRPAVEGSFRARGHILKLGRTMIFGAAEIRDARSRIVATGQATYALIDDATA